MNKTSETRISWTGLIVALALLCSMFSFSAMAQTEQEKPLGEKAAAALIDELKSGLSDLIGDEAAVTVIIRQWDARKDLAGKTRSQILELLFEDVNSVVEDEDTRNSVRASWEAGSSETNPQLPVATPTLPTGENQKSAQTAKPVATTRNQNSVAELTIGERQVDDVTILNLEGKITGGGGATALRNAIRGLLDEGKKKIVLNCKGVSHIDEDGIGIGAMVAGYNAVKAVDGQLKLVNLPPFLKELFAINKLLTVFDTYDDEAEALNSFKP